MLAYLSTTWFSITVSLAIVTSEQMTLFLTTAPSSITTPRPMMQFSTVPAISEPLEMRDFFTEAPGRYWVGHASFVLV